VESRIEALTHCPLTLMPLGKDKMVHDHNYGDGRSHGPLPSIVNLLLGFIWGLARDITISQYTGSDPAIFQSIQRGNLRQIIDAMADFLENPPAAYGDLFRAAAETPAVARAIRDNLAGDTSTSLEVVAEAMRGGALREPSRGTSRHIIMIW
jgi:hypothetical protein